MYDIVKRMRAEPSTKGLAEKLGISESCARHIRSYNRQIRLDEAEAYLGVENLPEIYIRQRDILKEVLALHPEDFYLKGIIEDLLCSHLR